MNNNDNKKNQSHPSLISHQTWAHTIPTTDHHPHHHNSKNPNIIIRSTRRVSDPGPSSDPDGSGSDQESDSDDDERRKKDKVKLQGRFSSDDDHHRIHDLNSVTCDSNVGGGGGGGADPDALCKDRRTDFNENEEERRLKVTSGHNGTTSDMVAGPATPLPDKMLLVSILDKLQKKDTRGVYAEPVDPEEISDYHDIIEKPMDFSTIRKKLDGGLYSALEELEADVFLICSNAMTYNPSHTIYFRQARSIQELAKLEFKRLRQTGRDDTEEQSKPDTEQPLAAPKRRRGRPPGSSTKKKFLESSTPDRVSPALPSVSTLTSGGDDASKSCHYNLRKGPSLVKYDHVDGSPRASNSGSNIESRSTFSDSVPKALPKKYSSRIQSELEDGRRSTYNPPAPLSSNNDLCVQDPFGQERQQLVPTELHSKHGYARSLAHFAADLGPVAWRVASKKIKSVLPPGVEFGPGWIGENVAYSTHQSLPLEPISLSNSPHSYDTSGLQRPSTSDLSNASPSHKQSMPSEGYLVGPRRIDPQQRLKVSNRVVGAPGMQASYWIQDNDAGRLNIQPDFTTSDRVVGGRGKQTPYWMQDSSVVQCGTSGVGGGFGLDPQEELRPGSSYANSRFMQATPMMPGQNTGIESIPRASPYEVTLTMNPVNQNRTREWPSKYDYRAAMDAGAADPWFQASPFQPNESPLDMCLSSSVPDDKNARFQASSSQSLENGWTSEPDLGLQL